MKLDKFIFQDGKELRCGYTTGSCAAAASKAAAIMLESGKRLAFVEIDTPAGIRLKLEVASWLIGEDYAEASIVKDGGDDPDATHGMEIFSRVSKRKDSQILIDGGEGIGRIVKKGLFGQPGQAAINPVPRQMIEKELKGVSDGGYDVLIHAPMGQEIGTKTFNKNIGIEGGISIIGSSGIVYPMSDEALIKTIYMELDQIALEQGTEEVLFVPGNYGEKLADEAGLVGARVKVSNFIGESLQYAYSKGFKKILLLGHVGKFSKLSIGIFNTHNRVSDARMEAFVYYLALMEAPLELLKEIDGLITAEEALNTCIDMGYGGVVRLMEEGAKKRIVRYLKDEDYPVEVYIYSMERGLDIC